MLKFLGFLLLAYFLYVIVMMVYFEMITRGDNYFAKPLAERRRIRALIKSHARFIYPLFDYVSRVYQLKSLPLFHYDGVTGPLMMSSKKSYAFTKHYQPQENDIVVATQMKCGTTWMQQVIFEVLHRGQGDLSDKGYRHMYALSPWIETTPTSSVPFERAPLVGEKNSRIIKTHMPAKLFPYSPKAKYVYVARHPVSCFASCFDFINLLAGPLLSNRETLLKWFCSDDMLWLSWPEHVEGWWRRAEAHDNILFVHYESMKRDLRGVVIKVAKFLDMELSDAEIDRVVAKSSFDYMKEHEEHFEMFSPNIFSTSAKKVRFMQAGTVDRYKDVSDEESATIMTFCRQRLKGAHYPLDYFYPDAKALAKSESTATVELLPAGNVI